MSNLWERFDGIATPSEVENAKSQFEPIEAGKYEVVLEELAPSESQNGLPMLKGKFRTLENRVIFYNQMLQNASNPTMTAVNIAEAVKFLDGITGEEVAFTSLGALANRVTEITLGGRYEIEVSYGKKDLEQKFPKLKVLTIVPDAPFL
jgi:hypothetical protein